MSAATDKTNLAELRRTMTLWHNRVTALGFDGVSDLIALAEAGGEEMKKTWPIGERIALKLMMIKQIGEGSTTANSLPHVARIADEALECIRWRPAAQATPEPVGEAPIWNSIQIASWIGSQLMHEPAMFERAAVCKFVRSLGRHATLLKHSPKDHAPAPGVPEGFVLAPVEPTPEMIRCAEMWDDGFEGAYARALAAAQAKK